MNKEYQSLEDVLLEAERLVKLPMKKLADMSYETMIDFFEATEKQIVLKTQELAIKLEFDKLRSVKLAFFKKRSRLGTCDSDCNIKIDFETLLGCDYDGVISVIIHELCHTERHNHSKEFWALFERSCKRIGILSPDYDGWTEILEYDNPYMYNSPWEYHRHPQKYKIIRDKICNPLPLSGIYGVRRKCNSLLFSDIYRLKEESREETITQII